ncbi:Protein RMD9, mitochondrial [Frankliniella fusca]|uniref:Protein RMD9, mitochondrial n=1 Tax=Frankliniella fusca TaxID=407009 RepID=A0AAE1LII3_9NEOP|nr:Protein RMD9, mitochondrial [Frankliniella fusca]KAK3921534.1 Protein RMD9, mitochondrial [Frankliniella fusca]
MVRMVEMEAALDQALETYMREVCGALRPKRRRRVSRIVKRQRMEEIREWCAPPPRCISPFPPSPESVPYHLTPIDDEYVQRGINRSNGDDPRGWMPETHPRCLSPLPPSPHHEPEDQFLRKHQKTPVLS